MAFGFPGVQVDELFIQHSLFSPAGAEGFKKDDPNTTIQFYDTGHFAPETHGNKTGQDILEFMYKLPR